MRFHEGKLSQMNCYNTSYRLFVPPKVKGVRVLIFPRQASQQHSVLAAMTSKPTTALSTHGTWTFLSVKACNIRDTPSHNRHISIISSTNSPTAMTSKQNSLTLDVPRSQEILNSLTLYSAESYEAISFP